MAASPTLPWPAIHKRFTAVLGANRVLKRREDLLAYDCDGLTLHRRTPHLVVLPRSTAEVVTTVKLCAELGLPFVARGSGTGLSGGALASEGSVLIVTSRMRRILDIDVDNQTVLVEPGVINNWVTRAVAWVFSGLCHTWGSTPPWSWAWWSSPSH